jgi:hypothetical protein
MWKIVIQMFTDKVILNCTFNVYRIQIVSTDMTGLGACTRFRNFLPLYSSSMFSYSLAHFSLL